MSKLRLSKERRCLTALGEAASGAVSSTKMTSHLRDKEQLIVKRTKISAADPNLNAYQNEGSMKFRNRSNIHSNLQQLSK